MKKIKVITALLMIFTLGLVTGSLGTKYILKKQWQQFQAVNPTQKIERLVDQLKKDLGLSQSQTIKVREIIVSNAVPLEELHKQFAPILRQVRTKTMAEIRLLLDEKQKVKLDQLEKRSRKHMRPHLPPPEPFGPPPDQ